ncbi:MAG: prenyltransferase/squalene oxidase repeat-containing protein [Pirellulales bacterium]
MLSIIARNRGCRGTGLQIVNGPVQLLMVVLAAAIGSLAASAREPNAAQVQKSVDRAIQYLGSKAQADDGSFSSRIGPGPTALIVMAVLRNGRGVRDPLVAKGLKYLETFVQSDGGIHATKSRLPTYETCLAIVCFQAANTDGKYDETIKKADAYLKGLQDLGGADGEADPGYGGASYGKDQRPDLSNTHFLVEALRAAGNGEDDEAVQRALVFVSRCQNLESEHNTTPLAAKVNDGGFYYTPIGEGSSPAGNTANGGLRSYGAMSYAGLKSMLYAGVDADDPRVKAAIEWIGQNYSVAENPGLGQAGVYYYYHLFAKALDALGHDEIADAQGKPHSWRADLAQELAKRQQKDGSWINTDSRWMEGDPGLCTGFALLALSYCRQSDSSSQSKP